MIVTTKQMFAALDKETREKYLAFGTELEQRLRVRDGLEFMLSMELKYRQGLEYYEAEKEGRLNEYLEAKRIHEIQAKVTG